MTKIKCVIIEDEAIAREDIGNYVRQFDFLELTGSYSNADDALAFLKSHPVDLLFLDIHLPNMSGIELASRLDFFLPAVIFTTAHAKYALEGYKVNSIGYLMKPIFFEDFEKAALKAKSFFEYRLLREETALYVKANGEDVKVIVQDILYIKSLQNYINIYLPDKKIIALQTLKSIKEQLPDTFIQTHRSYVVNVEKIDKVTTNELHIGPHVIPVSQRMKSAIKAKLEALMHR